MKCSRGVRLSVAVSLSLALVLAALAAPTGAATGDPGSGDIRAGEQSLQIWAYFDGDTPVSGGRVRVYADGKKLNSDGPGPVRTFSRGEAMLRFDSLPSALRIVVSGGRAGGERVDGSLSTKVRDVTDGDLVHVNPVTTVSDRLAQPKDGLRHERRLTKRTLGIRPVLSNYDLYVTDRWFEGDRFRRWAMEQGSVGAGARALVQIIEQPGFDRRQFDPPDGGNPKARVAAGGDASARNVVNGLLAGGGAIASRVISGLLGAVGSATGLTGPAGFAVSGAVLFFNELIDLGLQSIGNNDPEEDPVSKALRGLSEQLTQLQLQVTELQNRLDKRFLENQIRPATTMVTDIRATQAKFLSMLKYATEVDNAVSDADRKTKLANLAQGMKNFLSSAEKLEDGNVDAHLHQALTGEETEGIRPVAGDPLIPAVRREVAKERFFTNESSQKIRNFFRYYEWAQTELATVLTEYYMAGGDCAKTFILNHQVKEVPTSADCGPVGDVAKEDVDRIQKNIAKQDAMVPPKVLDQSVFIDRQTKLMWRTEPTIRGPREILNDGLKCADRHCSNAGGQKLSASLDNTKRTFGGDAYDIPHAGIYRELFAGPGPSNEPLARLNSIGLRRSNGEPLMLQGNPAGYLWLKGDFYVEGETLNPHGGYKDISALLYELRPGGPNPPRSKEFLVAARCAMGSEVPTLCSSYGRDLAYILWYRGPIDASEAGAYWCQPGKPVSWDPANC